MAALLPLVLAFSLSGLVLGVTVVVLLFPSGYVKKETETSVQILVLGDIGRSPRMQYHAISVARHHGRVDLIGYLESSPHPDLIDNEYVKIHPLSPPPSFLRSGSIPFIISGPLKVLWQVWTLIRVLGYKTEPAKWLLVQNPPSIPTLAIAMFVSILRNTQLMIDWHNYGWTILAGTKGRSHPFVEISKAYECALGQAAPTANITVTHAMASQLREAPYHVQTPILTLHDRPPLDFWPLESPEARRTFLTRLPETKDFASSILDGTTRLIVSSTSWTPDEDFSLLLDALVSYASGNNNENRTKTPLLAIITGRGPQKQFYESRISALTSEGRLPGIKIVTAWLTISDYATLLRCSDLGVCLHMSSSGVDLPMKVVDMFGSGLPVAAYSNYPSFGELVREGENGCGFETAAELAEVLGRLLGGGGGGEKELERLREGARKEGNVRWEEEWDRVIKDTLFE